MQSQTCFKRIRAVAFLAVLGHTIIIKPDGGEGHQETCATLRNHETHSSVEISIGNPPQSFSLVADTGSDKVVVKDCACKNCRPEWGPGCFLGPHHSSSFNLSFFMVEDEHKGHQGHQGHKVKKHLEEAHMYISFGSGSVGTRVASDEVRLGSLKTYMKHGLLLIVDESLEIHDRFEGILGLGRPDFKGHQALGHHRAAKRAGMAKKAEELEEIHVPSFFEQAKVQRFSLCFNHQADGVLGMNTPASSNRLSSVGQVHWGLDFQGISVGDQKQRLKICNPASKKKGMQSACGLIPDSGTTLIAAAEPQLLTLYESVCNNWSRCKETHQQIEKDAAAGKLPVMSANESQDGQIEVHTVETLQALLTQCSDWMAGVDLNKEMPKLTFHVAGANGNKEELVINPRNYILLSEAEVEIPTIIKSHGRKTFAKVKQQKQVCTMAFTPLEYETASNGPVWIMGMPLFYEHTVHYDRGNGKEQGVTMAFTRQDKEGCGECRSVSTIVRKKRKTVLLSNGVSMKTGLASLNRITKQPLLRSPKNFESM